MLRVSASARIAGLQMAAMLWKGSASEMRHYTQKDLDDEGFVMAYDPSHVSPSILPYVEKQLDFSMKFLKDNDRVFSSDVILAYEWYVSTFDSYRIISETGITAEDLGFPVGRWEEYMSGRWCCSEELQTCINLACEMGTKEDILFMYKKLLKAFSLRPTVGFVPDYWTSNTRLEDKFRTPAEGVDDPEASKRVTCCFTVTKEVAAWLKEKRNMTKFVTELIQEEMKK